MKTLLLLTLVSTLFWTSVFAESVKGSYEQIIVYTCQSALAQYKFGCDDTFWKCACEYQPLFGSVVQCMDAYLPPSVKMDKAEDRLIQMCSKFAKVDTLTKKEIQNAIKNSSSFIITPGEVDFDKDAIHYVPILPFKDDVTTKIKDYRSFLGNIDLSQHYGVLINYFWIGSLAYFAMFNTIKSKKSLNDKLIGKKINWIRSKFSLPLLFGTHFQPFIYMSNLTSLLPTTSEFLILSIYFFLNSIFLVCGFNIYSSNKIFGPSLILQTTRYIADRSGILAFAHFPLLIIFAGRNNLLIKFSGLPYSSFMMFHKWTARVMMINATIHTIAYFGIIIGNRTLGEEFSTLWFKAGIFATFFGLVMIFAAIHTIRVKYYETFLITHIIFAIIFFHSCYEHCLTFGWLDWIQGAMAFWVLDRVIRVYRLVKFGAPMAQIEFISDETFKISVKRPLDWNPYPGCFVFIHFLHPSIFWQSHPFTIMDSVLNDNEVTIYIKAKEGLTKKVLDIVGNDIVHMRVSLEGPYGNKSPVDSTDSVLLIAGGNGIPGPFYHALHLVQTPLILKQRVRLIWVIRKIESIKWFEEELRQLLDTDIECDIYITRDFNQQEVSDIPILEQFSKKIRFHSGRAPTSKILLDEFNNARGSIGIVTCGPSIMCDEIRDFVSKNLDQCPYRVDLYEELQVW